ncbi:class B sortase, partial [Turicibacter sanguinis]|nr:class B sortase [Turicibacter sanguinis]
MKKIMKLLVYLVLILILIFSSSSIYVKLAEYKKADDIYEEIRGISAPNQDNRDDSEGNHSNENNRYKELTSINSDYRFWLKIENTNIDYPVVQSQDNQYYLKHDFNKNYLASGSIFMDYR